MTFADIADREVHHRHVDAAYALALIAVIAFIAYVVATM